MVEAFPLHWPIGHERTSKYQRKKAPFKTTRTRARDSLMQQLKLMRATGIVVSSNVATYMRSGQEIMYSDQSAAQQDPGIAVYFMWNKEQYCIFCDKWDQISDNLQACMKTIEAIRGIERWGTGEMMKAAFSGFKPLPEPVRTVQSWWEVLGVNKHAFDNDIRDAYRKLSMIHHPDKGGNPETFHKINTAYQQGIKSKESYQSAQ